MIYCDAAFIVNNLNQVMMVLEEDINLDLVSGFSVSGLNNIVLYHDDNTILFQDCPINLIKFKNEILIARFKNNKLLQCKEIKEKNKVEIK